jgi:hypothetical protein
VENPARVPHRPFVPHPSTLLRPAAVAATATATYGPPETSSDDPDSSYVELARPAAALSSPGHCFPPQASRTVEHSPWVWNQVPVVAASSAGVSGYGCTPPAPHRPAATTGTTATHIHPPAPTCTEAPHRDPAPVPPAPVATSLADAIPSLRRVDTDLRCPNANAGSPSSHGSGRAAPLPAKQRPHAAPPAHHPSLRPAAAAVFVHFVLVVLDPATHAAPCVRESPTPSRHLGRARGLAPTRAPGVGPTASYPCSCTGTGTNTGTYTRPSHTASTRPDLPPLQHQGPPVERVLRGHLLGVRP